ncbi:hypothetical protein Emag_003627 [Eimeria magna]
MGHLSRDRRGQENLEEFVKKNNNKKPNFFSFNHNISRSRAQGDCHHKLRALRIQLPLLLLRRRGSSSSKQQGIAAQPAEPRVAAA